MITEPLINKSTEGIAISQKSEGKKENLKQRAYLNTLSSLLDYIANRLTGLFVNPFIVGGLGPSLFGIWQMLGQLTGYINIADTRASQVLKWTVAQKKDVATTDELRSDTGAAFIVLLLLMPVILIGGAVISWYAPIITHAGPAHYTLIRTTCALLVFSLIIFKFFELFEAILRGMNLSFKRMGLRAGIVIIGGGLKVLVIKIGLGLAGLAAVQLFDTLLVGISFYIVVKKNIGWFGIKRPTRANILRFGKLSAWYLADAGANVVNNNSDKLLLGIITNPVTVTYYTLTKFIPMALQGIINRLILGIMPGVGKLLGLKEYDKINSVRKKIHSVTLLLTTAFGVTVIIFNHSFLKVWVGKEHFAGQLANVMIMITIMQDTYVKNDACIINATLDIKKKVFLTLISGVLFASFGILLASKWGITGLCLALIISRLFLFIGQRKILAGIMQLGARTMFNINFRPIITSFILLGTAVWLASLTGVVTFYQLVLLAPTAFITSLSVFYFCGLSKTERQELWQIVTSIKFLKSDKAFSKN
ncbi:MULTISPECIES: lipopolysaccharide biosynthesis protein [Niastella]|uniref:Oligosaccharide flippase family protein n=1 Tax=Niastella soli TaxID=2821487 RepID=A0ABS3YSV5_9BACT|nr:oligosaccharide flippase family protein [Niastella soli]MBO9200515.1 oligosaccharide flippase family protein [Niastella soli]